VKKNFSIFLFFLTSLFPVLCFSADQIAGHSPSISVLPAEAIIQGEPIFVSVSDIAKNSSVKKMFFDDKALPVFSYSGKPSALIGIDLYKRAGDYKLLVEFSDGGKIEKVITIKAREKIEAPLGIPEKLGGNTKASQNNLVSTLSSENVVLASLRTGLKAFWTEKFRPPFSGALVVTDGYGYTRITGNYSISHKGTDFKADIGTSVLSMNRGVVRLVRNFRNYGKTVVVDHGLGLMTFYMHLSKIKVNEGELVLPGQLVGLSGDTGYAEKPHLHLTMRIGGISIDPVKFMALFP
jgi:murein DD-endopeptidase MepM/ murein hydrolase activator NlpD